MSTLGQRTRATLCEDRSDLSHLSHIKAVWRAAGEFIQRFNDGIDARPDIRSEIDKHVAQLEERSGGRIKRLQGMVIHSRHGDRDGYTFNKFSAPRSD
jgi:hypothetical protein